MNNTNAAQIPAFQAPAAAPTPTQPAGQQAPTAAQPAAQGFVFRANTVHLLATALAQVTSRDLNEPPPWHPDRCGHRSRQRGRKDHHPEERGYQLQGSDHQSASLAASLRTSAPTSRQTLAALWLPRRRPDQPVSRVPDPAAQGPAGQYKDPVVVFAEFPHADLAAVNTLMTDITAQQTIAATQILAFHPIKLSDNVATRSWSVADWTPSTAGTPAALCAYARAGFMKILLTDATAIQHIAQMTQAHSAAPVMDRVLEVTDTVDAVYFPHETDPLISIISIYMRPCTDNAADQECLLELLRTKHFHMGPISFTPKSRNGEAAECVICKADDHFASPASPTESSPAGAGVAADVAVDVAALVATEAGPWCHGGGPQEVEETEAAAAADTADVVEGVDAVAKNADTVAL
ncbi:hypothetical protein B0H13DRAFT_2373805 [Mycena leptocephala]|nr:hypothetical protein B0H13DRAFT_2373805 [Mycena leptocephala]